MPTPRTSAEFSEELEIQLHLLTKSAHEFDDGDIHEYRNIARALRLIYDKDDHQNPSLLELAGKAQVQILDTRMVVHPLNISPYFGLAGMVYGESTVGCRAFLDDAPDESFIARKDWLEDPVVDDKQGTIFGRLRLIKAVANIGGGTHFPPEVREYFSRLQALGMTAVHNGKNIEQRYFDVEKHSIRQVAHETLRTFLKDYHRGAQFESGAIMVGPLECVMLPGRKLSMNVLSKSKDRVANIADFSQEFTGFGASHIPLPYDKMTKKQACACRSGLMFGQCCSEEREFDNEFMEAFMRRYNLLGRWKPNSTGTSFYISNPSLRF